MTIQTAAWIAFAIILFGGVSWIAYELYNAPSIPDETDSEGAQEGTRWK